MKIESTTRPSFSRPVDILLLTFCAVGVFQISLDYLNLLLAFLGVKLDLTLVLAVALVIAGGWNFRLFLSRPDLRPVYIVFSLYFVMFLLCSIPMIPVPPRDFDILQYHSLMQGNYFAVWTPTSFMWGGLMTYLFPLSDRITGAFSLMLGWRMGTLANTLLISLIATVIHSLLSSLLSKGESKASIRATAVVFPLAAVAIGSEYLMANLNSYMNDLWALPLLFRLVWELDPSESDRPQLHPWFLPCLAGLVVSLKFTNLIFLGPLALLLFVARPDFRNVRMVFRVAGSIAFCIAPYIIFNVWQTGNPLFPILNGHFKSDFFFPENFRDTRFLAKGITEILAWPLVTFETPGRFSELVITSGRLAVGYVGAFGVSLLLVFLQLPKGRYLGMWLVLVVTSTLCWAQGVAYVRYALFVDLLGTTLLIGMGLHLLRHGAHRIAQLAGIGCLLATLPATVKAQQHYFLKRCDWGWRVPYAQDPTAWKQNLPRLFRDHIGTPLVRTPQGDEPQFLLLAEPSFGYMKHDNPRADVFNLVIFDKVMRDSPTKKILAEGLMSLRRSGKDLQSIVTPNQLKEAKELLSKYDFVVFEESSYEPSWITAGHQLIRLRIRSSR